MTISTVVIAFLQREAFSVASDAIKNRPLEFYMTPVVKKAREKTVARFPQLKKSGLNFILERWCHSDRFKSLANDFRENPNSVTEEIVFVGFRSVATDFNASHELLKLSVDIVSAFFEELHDSLLRAPKEAIPFAVSLIDHSFQEQSQQITQLGDKINGIPSEVASLIADILTQRGIISQAPQIIAPTVETSENNPFDDKWKASIDLALQSSESNEPEDIAAARVTVKRVRNTDGFNQSSPTFKARVATIAALCAMAGGDSEGAAKEVQAALDFAPGDVHCLSNAANTAVLEGKYERAIELAQKVREQEPRSLSAATVLLQSWRVEKPDRIEEFLKEEPWVLESSDGCAALALIRDLQGQFDEAIALAEKALETDSDNVEALQVLYDALYHPILTRWQNHEIRSHDEASISRMERAEDAISRAIVILESGINKIKLHRALSNRAAVRNSLGKVDAALSDCDAILNSVPTTTERDLATLNKGMIFVMAERHKEAIPFLESLKSEERIQQGASALANCYYLTGSADKAIKIWEDIWNPEECSVAQLVTADMLMVAYWQLQLDEKVTSVLDKLKNFCPDNLESQSLIAQAEYRRGDKVRAIQTLRHIAESCAQNGEVAVRIRTMLRIANLFFAEREFQEAIDTLNEIGWDELTPQTHQAYLYALVELGSPEGTLEVAQSIGKEGFNSYAARVEAQILIDQEKWGEAKRITAELIEHEPDDRQHKMNHCAVAVRDNDLDAARISLQGITYESIKNEADVLRQVSRLHAELKSPESVRFAFRARQIDFGNPESHQNLFQVYIMAVENRGNQDDAQEVERTKRNLGLVGPQLGEVPCSIQLLPVGVADERQRQTFTILEEGPFDQLHGVYSPRHEFAQRLLALKFGESISLKEELSRLQPSVKDDRLYQLSAYLDPYFFASQESMLKGFDLFGGQVGMIMKDMRGDINEIWDAIDNAGRDFSKLTESYKKAKFPLSCVGIARNRTLIDLWFWFSRYRPWEDPKGVGGPEGFDKLVEGLNQGGDKPSLVLDATGLISLAQLELEEILSSNFRLLVPESLLDEVEEWCSEAAPVHVPGELPAKILSIIETKTEVCGITTEQTLPPVDIQKWRKLAAQSDLDAALLAVENKIPLYSEDVALRYMVKIQPGCQGIGTHHVLSYLIAQESITAELYTELLDKMGEAQIQVFVFLSSAD